MIDMEYILTHAAALCIGGKASAFNAVEQITYNLPSSSCAASLNLLRRI